MLAAKPGEPEVLTDLLVGAGGEDHVAGGAEALSPERRNGRRGRRAVALHVQGSASPDLVVAKLARPGAHRPLTRIGKDRVRVGEEEDAGPLPAPGDPRHEIRPLG